MSARVLVVDNRDSFTWNLAHVFLELGATTEVVDVEALVIDDMGAHSPDLVVLGPGPRGPDELPALRAVVRALVGRAPIFGVCLGLQALVLVEGGEVGRATRPLHGKTCRVSHDDTSVLRGLPSPFEAMRYNSLVATRVPPRFRVCARDDDGQVMAIVDEGARIAAVQFHPESIGTAGGRTICAAALRMAGQPAVVVERSGSIPPPARATDPSEPRSS